MLTIVIFYRLQYHLTLRGSYKIKGCQLLPITSIIFLCAIGHFVHLLLSLCNSYSVINSVTNLEQLKITFIFLVNNTSVHGYLLYPFYCI